jgi:hypothetical protein
LLQIHTQTALMNTPIHLYNLLTTPEEHYGPDLSACCA